MLYFEFETVFQFYNLGVRGLLHLVIMYDISACAYLCLFICSFIGKLTLFLWSIKNYSCSIALIKQYWHHMLMMYVIIRDKH